MAQPWIVLDFETLSACDLTKAGSDRYAQDFTTEALCLCFETSGRKRGSWVDGDPIPQLILDAIANPEVMFVAHQAGFERSIWHWQMEKEHGWPAVPLERWHDTMARAQQLVLPAGLDRVLQVLKLPVSKDMEGNALIKRINREYAKTGIRPDTAPDMMRRIVDYCFVDIDGQVALHCRIGWLSDHEREIWLASTRVNDRGIRLDRELVSAMQEVVDQATGPLARRFEELTGGLRFGQIQKVKAWVEGRGVPIKNLAKETLVELLGSDEEPDATDDEAGYADPEGDEWDVGVQQPHALVLPDDVREALGIRQLVGSASVKKLKVMRTCAGYDGRARGLLQYHGTGPGRQSSKLLQAHNFPRGSLKEDGDTPDPTALIKTLKLRNVDLIESMYGPAVETVVSSLRHCLIADPGCVYVSGDYAQIQCRTVLALAGQDDKVELMRLGHDVYCDMAGNIYKRVVTKKDLIERQTGKNSVLGLGFQMGGKTFFIKYGKGQTLEFCEGVVSVYRKEWAPRVPLLWYDLQDAAIKCVWDGTPQTADCGITYYMEDQWLVARFFNGSTIHYFNPQKTRRSMPWDETDVRRGFSYQVMKQGRWVTRDAFGGQLTENAVMKIEREIMEDAKKRLEANGFPVVLEVHDEIVTEPMKVDADLKAFRQIQEDVQPWTRAMLIPIKVDVWSGPEYRK